MSQSSSSEYLCPVHSKPLKKKQVLYGLIDDVEKLPKNAILGGCVVDEDRKYGYVCPVDDKAYFLDEDGRLVPQYEDDEKNEE